MTVRFSKAPERTADGGRKYPARELIHIPLDGGIHELARPATDEDRRRYPQEYAAAHPEAKPVAESKPEGQSPLGRVFGKRK